MGGFAVVVVWFLSLWRDEEACLFRGQLGRYKEHLDLLGPFPYHYPCLLERSGCEINHRKDFDLDLFASDFRHQIPHNFHPVVLARVHQIHLEALLRRAVHLAKAVHIGLQEKLVKVAVHLVKAAHIGPQEKLVEVAVRPVKAVHRHRFSYPVVC